jgi:hypothetical protein
MVRMGEMVLKMKWIDLKLLQESLVTNLSNDSDTTTCVVLH